MLPAIALAAMTLCFTPKNVKLPTNSSPHLEITSVDGSVEVKAGEANEATVVATQVDGKTNSPWNVEVRGGGDEVEVEVCCGPCGLREHRDCNSESGIRLTLQVPRESRLEITSVSASIDVRGVAGQQALKTVSGHIDTEGNTSTVNVETVSGKVLIAPSKLARTRVNGVSSDVTVRLPASADARVTLHSVSGKLNDRTVNLGADSMEFGTGRVPVEVHTVSGSVVVAQAN